MKLDLVRRILDASVAKAADMGVPMAVAVCDGGGHVLGLFRMDDCMILAVETVQAKARAAVYFRRPTHETVERSRHHPTVYASFTQASAASLVLSMGGYPLWEGDRIAGAIAAAGGTGAQDMEVAQAGLAVWEGQRD